MEKLSEATLVEVWSNTHGSIGYTTDKAKRVWQIAGTSRKVTLGELMETAGTVGGRNLLESGALLIKDNKARDYLGLPILDKYDLDIKQMQELLKSKDKEEIKDFLAYCSNQALETFVRVAIELPVTDMEISNLIRDYSGKDIVSVVQDRLESEDNEEEVREETTANRPRRKVVRREQG